jgi:hypothetical protein
MLRGRGNSAWYFPTTERWNWIIKGKVLQDHDHQKMILLWIDPKFWSFSELLNFENILLMFSYVNVQQNR